LFRNEKLVRPRMRLNVTTAKELAKDHGSAPREGGCFTSGWSLADAVR
jgi:hypothetical protein